MSDFLELSVKPKEPSEENAEIIIAFLSEYPFDVFEFTDGLVKAFGAAVNFDGDAAEIKHTIAHYADSEVGIRFIPKENWNELWEKNFFEPVTIKERVHIRAEFHPAMPSVPYEIVIQPRMSFGTGHHATTQLMVTLMLEKEAEFSGTKVLDMGSGTGVLAIVAEKFGAREIDAVDIEEWSFVNIEENAIANGCSHISAYHGDAGFLKNRANEYYDFVLANIHKQVLLSDVREYARVLKPKGQLFVSGFYPDDLQEIVLDYERYSLTLIEQKTLNQWCAAVFVKH